MTDFKNAYKKWGNKVKEIMRDPSDIERAGMLPATQRYTREDGRPFTVGDYYDLTDKLWKARQSAAIVKLLMEAAE